MADMYLCPVTVLIPNNIVSGIFNSINISESPEEAAQKAQAAASEQIPHCRIVHVEVVPISSRLVQEAAERVLGWSQS